MRVRSSYDSVFQGWMSMYATRPYPEASEYQALALCLITWAGLCLQVRALRGVLETSQKPGKIDVALINSAEHSKCAGN